MLPTSICKHAVKTIQHTLKVLQIVNNLLNFRHQNPSREEGGGAGGISCVAKVIGLGLGLGYRVRVDSR